MIKQIKQKKAQALVELATFGSILLFCLGMLVQYGMRANYQQNLQMQAFRKAMQAAYFKTGPAAGMSLTKLKDKAMPDPRDPWGFADRQPVASGASVTWDTNLQTIHTLDYTDDTNGLGDSDLPRTIIEINNVELTPADLTDVGIDTIGPGHGAHRTAMYGEKPFFGDPTQSRNILGVVLENPAALRESTKEAYRRAAVPYNQIKVEAIASGKLYAFVTIDGLKHRLDSADVDEDGQLETIIAVKGGVPGALDEHVLYGVNYIDYQEGQINSDYTAVQPWEVNKDKDNDGNLTEHQQGLTSDYTIDKAINATLSKTEDSTSIISNTDLTAQQNITHSIRFNDNTTQNYTTTFYPPSFIVGPRPDSEQASFTYEVAK